jgi:hypothetical protein
MKWITRPACPVEEDVLTDATMVQNRRSNQEIIPGIKAQLRELRDGIRVVDVMCSRPGDPIN